MFPCLFLTTALTDGDGSAFPSFASALRAFRRANRAAIVGQSFRVLSVVLRLVLCAELEVIDFFASRDTAAAIPVAMAHCSVSRLRTRRLASISRCERLASATRLVGLAVATAASD